MKQFERKLDAAGKPYLETSVPGALLTRLPLLNKGTSFTPEERREFGLEGMLPPHLATLEEQVQVAYGQLRTLTAPLEKHVFLRALQDRSEVVFYALLDAHLEEMLPLIYTPVVAEAVEQFSRIYRYPRGLVVTPDNLGRLDALLQQVTVPDVQLVVATDNEGILGIGDQGFGGLAICIGKLSLYTAAAGVDPSVTLPVELDVGTDRQDLLDDPHYLGVRMRRLNGQAYDDFIHAFVTALRRRFPRALLQWEDFSKQKAFDVNERYREAGPSFNDDIQGTGAVVLAGLVSAMRLSQQRLEDQVVVVHGAGAGGVGVARQVVLGMVREGMPLEEARKRLYLIDSKGLIMTDRPGMEPYKRELAQDPERAGAWGRGGKPPTLLETVRGAKATVLLGLSGQRGAFGEEVVRAVGQHTPYPIVFALSNPTSLTEAQPEDVLRWTDGRALVATGSPFADVVRQGRTHAVGQGNNAFIFPGLGLGVLLSRARRVTDDMLTEAAYALAGYVDGGRLAQGGLYPRIERLRGASRRVACAVMRQAVKEGVAEAKLDEHALDALLEERAWKPEFLPLRRAAP